MTLDGSLASLGLSFLVRQVEITVLFSLQEHGEEH